MITEDYVSFETAKLLKEKGFDWELLSNAYLFKGNTYELAGKLIEADADVIIPTQATAMKWLREVHKIAMWVEGHNRRYKGYIHSEQRGDESLFYEDSYEQACEAAIKYCLENLI